eukprot:2046291-Rhodomonas_salina.1
MVSPLTPCAPATRSPVLRLRMLLPGEFQRAMHGHLRHFHRVNTTFYAWPMRCPVLPYLPYAMPGTNIRDALYAITSATLPKRCPVLTCAMQLRAGGRATHVMAKRSPAPQPQARALPGTTQRLHTAKSHVIAVRAGCTRDAKSHTRCPIPTSVSWYVAMLVLRGVRC